jgi:hypothetical protein
MGDEYGEKLLPLAEQGPLYPFDEAPYNRSKFWNNTNNNTI